MDPRQQAEMAYDRLYALYQAGTIRPDEMRTLQAIDAQLRPIWEAEAQPKLDQYTPTAKERIAGAVAPLMRTPTWLREPGVSDAQAERDAYQRAYQATGLLDWVPGLSGTTSAYQAAIDAGQGNAAAAAENIAWSLLDLIPAAAGARKLAAPVAAKGLSEGMIDVADQPIARKYFADRLTEAQASHGPIGKSVDVYSPDEYAGLRMAMTPEGDAGYAVKPTGEIVSVLKHKQSPVKDFAGKTMRRAEEQGGTWLNAFDTTLPGLYNRGGGFQPVARLPFSEDVARESWGDAATEAFMRANAKFNEGRPDVVFMARDPLNTAPVAPGQGGTTIDDWDLGIKMVQDYLKELGYVVPQN